MMSTTLDEIAKLLRRIDTGGTFATRATRSAKDLHLAVEGVGQVPLPVTPATARKLCGVAKPARHGYKNETRLDRGVRDTWEIPAERLALGERWAKTLAPQLERIRRDLGLPRQCRLRAQLHNLLIYGRGQFFAPHRDSEKADDMVGTLAVILPSRFTGGELVIEHLGKRLTVCGSARQLTFAAFYADCHHEVCPVRSGYRLALTYNLIAEGTAEAAVPQSLGALSARVRSFFKTPALSDRGDRDLSPPDRLVYLLDHEYTPHALAWNRLKNADAARAAALRQVARQLDCEIFLALADVHESWNCEEEYDFGRSRWNRYYDEDEEEDDGPESDGSYELTDLIDSDVELRHWVALEGGSSRVPTGRIGVANRELCFTTPSQDFEPFETEHEGYTGNAGNTVDHWYHRAAVALWPRDRAFVIRAKIDPRWALARIEKALAARHMEEASALARQLLPFWTVCVRREGKLLEPTLQVAGSLADPRTAAALLQPFSLSELTARSAPRLAALVDTYGLEWCRALLRGWAAEDRGYEPHESRLKWMSGALAQLSRALAARKSPGRALAAEVLTAQWAWLRRHRAEVLKREGSPSDRARALGGLARPMLALIESCGPAQQTALHRELIDALLENPAEILPLQLDLLRAAHGRLHPEALRTLGLKRIHQSCARELAARLRAPTRAPDDWSITTPLLCSCKLCAKLTRFLRAAPERRLEWPLAQAQRAHVHQKIDLYGLPMTHTTRRKGRPFTLVLEKTTTLFQHDTTARRVAREDLRWLEAAAGGF
ncbi:MAG: 2OG-Fe(II) oxygenase [Steroidobacteraceae bacterium]